MTSTVITRDDIWAMGSPEQFQEWLALAEQARQVAILRGLTLRELLAAMRYEWLDARMIGDD